MEGLPEGVFVGSVLDIPSEGIVKRVSEVLGEFGGGDVFWSLNGIGAPDVVVVYVSEGWSDAGGESESGGGGGEGGELGIVEEHCGGDGDGDECYWANSAVEILVSEGAKVTHCYVQRESANAAHIKWTVVRQESSSVYNLVEIGTEAKLSRHQSPCNSKLVQTLQQNCPHFTCVYAIKPQDLYSRLVLDHPRLYSNSSTSTSWLMEAGQAVFDRRRQSQ
ncbi:hypothetical protein Scep_022466 [Stephania cephalantha]|uniref:SUF system FeS cluster assembly SufBD core domain-containing protein n=1 Tax=Stephania cephalantha TaxID=152367 RepID=A0AAP0F837_9MAGN